MIKRYFLVAMFCIGLFLVCFAEGENNTNNEEDKECLQCSGTNEVDCASCIGTGMLIAKCNSCKGTGICQTCKGDGLIECKTCKGKGSILCNSCKGKGTKSRTIIGPNMTKRVEKEYCSSCNGRGSINCKTCDGKGKILCTKCKGAKQCSTCLGTGIIKGKGECKDCKGTGKVKCKYCESKGKINNQLIVTPEDIEDEISNLLEDTEKATELQREKIYNSFIEKWNKEFAGKIVKSEQKVEEVSQEKTTIWNEKKQEEEDVVTGIIVRLQLNNTDENTNYFFTEELKIHPVYEEQLTEVSVGDIIAFLLVLPPLSKSEWGIGVEMERIIIAMPIGYKKKYDDKLKEFK